MLYKIVWWWFLGFCEEIADLLAYFFKCKCWSEKEQHFLLTFCIIKLQLKLISSIMYLVTWIYRKIMFKVSSKPQQIFMKKKIKKCLDSKLTVCNNRERIQEVWVIMLYIIYRQNILMLCLWICVEKTRSLPGFVIKILVVLHIKLYFKIYFSQLVGRVLILVDLF